MEMYIFNDDKIGWQIARELMDAVKRGVQVRVLYDAIGCRGANSRFFDTMNKAGVHAIPYHPTRFWRPRFWTLIRRNHRKTLVCDSQVAFTGGVNISREWLPTSEGGEGWKDASIKIQGPAVGAIERIFLYTWNWRARRRLRLRLSNRDAPKPAGAIPLTIIANREVIDRFAIRRAALHAIRASRSRIYLASPYFLPDLSFMRSLANAAQRGIDVRLLLPETSDARIVDLACRATFGRLLPHGVRIFRHARMVHAKALLVDDVFVSVGSYNFDHRSLVYNLELVANAFDREFNTQTAEMLLSHMTDARELCWEAYRKRSLLSRVLERLAYSFRHWL
jgi:cardiolipin synthase